MEKLKVVLAERGIYPYLERIALKGNTFNDGCKTGTNVMNKDYARLLEVLRCQNVLKHNYGQKESSN